MPKRKYEVIGEDDLGDLHSFQTDDRERAEEIEKLMREDLEQVELVENSGQVARLPARSSLPERFSLAGGERQR